ncbi:hypothetical protein GCM10020001_088370 [Nonomuraea salmonea]
MATEYTITHSVTADDTTSTSVDSRSATRVMPIGAGQPPSSVTSGPCVSAATISTTDTASDTPSVTTLISDCSPRSRPPIASFTPAASSGSSTGTQTRLSSPLAPITAHRPWLSRRPRARGPPPGPAWRVPS